MSSSSIDIADLNQITKTIIGCAIEVHRLNSSLVTRGIKRFVL